MKKTTTKKVKPKTKSKDKVPTAINRSASNVQALHTTVGTINQGTPQPRANEAEWESLKAEIAITYQMFNIVQDKDSCMSISMSLKDMEDIVWLLQKEVRTLDKKPESMANLEEVNKLMKLSRRFRRMLE